MIIKGVLNNSTREPELVTEICNCEKERHHSALRKRGRAKEIWGGYRSDNSS